MKDKILLSFVIPCYRSEKTIELVVNEIISVVGEREEYDYEIIAVNDSSPDGVYTVLCGLAESNNKIKVVNLTKNMGKSSAMLAGYAFAKGDYIVNLDDDYQCPVNELWRLLSPLEEEDYDCSTANYKEKKESLFKRIGSDINLKMSEIMLEKPKGCRFENFSIMKRYVCEEIIQYKNPYPYIEGLVFRITNKVAYVPMEERNRADDKASGFVFSKSLSLFINGFTAFSVKPLRVATFIGLLFSMVGVLWGIYIVIRKLIHPEILMGYSSLSSILLVSTGMIMFMLGIVGEYIGRIYICINDSPQYVIRNTINI